MHKGKCGMIKEQIRKKFFSLTRGDKRMKSWITAVMFVLFFLNGCEDKSLVRVYDKTLLAQPPECLSLRVIPDDTVIEKSIRERFDFDPKCMWRLEVHFQDNIHCNSNQNSDRKALSAFPSSYLRMEIYRGMRMVYSYYIDLQKRADGADAARGISRIIEDLFTEK